MNLSEQQIVEKIADILASENPSVVFCLEAPAMGRSIDLAFFKKNKVVGVEFKLTNWKKALTQAKDYKLVCDYSYICLPSNKISDKVIEAAQEIGVGVFAVDFDNSWPFIEVLPSIVSTEKWPFAAKKLKSFIRAGCA